MKPIHFPEANVVFAKDQPQYTPLPAQKLENDPEGRVVTKWELSEAELLEIQKSKAIYISVLTFNDALQPMLPYVGHSSFITDPPAEPVEK